MKSLVKPKVPDSVFNLSDDLASGQTKLAFQSLDNYLESTSGDEKSSFIKILGLLAEQFRSLLLVNLLTEAKLSQSQMAEKLGWSTGRIFILSKHAKNFSISRLKQLLSQLLAIDYTIKSSDQDPRLLLEILISKSMTDRH